LYQKISDSNNRVRDPPGKTWVHKPNPGTRSETEWRAGDIIVAVRVIIQNVPHRLRQILLKDVKYSRTWAYIQAVAVVTVSYLFRVPVFSSAVIIVVVGLVAVFMTIRAEDKWGRVEQIVWFGLVTALSLLAIFSIRREEEKQNEQHLAIMSQFKASLEATVQKLGDVIARVERTESLSAQNLASVSGEGSYPCVVPQPESIRNRIPLVLWNKGKTNNLTGVQLRVLSTSEFLSQSTLVKPAIDLGTVPPTWPKQLPIFISPIPDSG